MEDLFTGLSYLVVFAAGVWLEWKYGAATSAATASIHAKLDAIKAALVAK